MDANSLLSAVANTYRNLESLAVEIRETSESLNRGGRSLNERSIKAVYLAPDKVRIEQEGRNGIVIVTNGSNQHTYFGGPKRYSKGPPATSDRLPGLFQPAQPISGTTFLFNRIADEVERAEILSEEPDGHGRTYVLSVAYQPSDRPRPVLLSPIRYWVDAETYLVKRAETEIEYRMWAHDETHSNRVTILVLSAVMNQPVASETFEFAPPADAIEMRGPGQGRGFVSVGGGGGGARLDPKHGWIEHHHSQNWDGETLVETWKLRVQGVDLTFERRLTFSEDRTQVSVVERTTTPAGRTEREYSVPLH